MRTGKIRIFLRLPKLHPPLIGQHLCSEREDKQRQKQREDNPLAQEGVMQKVIKRLEAACENDRIPETVEAGNIGFVLLGDDLLVFVHFHIKSFPRACLYPALSVIF